MNFALLFICILYFCANSVSLKTAKHHSVYTLKEGSIIATLTPEFVATLTAGEHTLGIVSASGTAVANFAVTADNASNTVSDNNSEKSPQTGDNSNIILWSIVAVISLAALCTTAIVSKKKKVR